MKRHEVVENELTQCNVRVEELVAQSDEMAHDDHFDTDAIRRNALESQSRLRALEQPAKARRADLAEALEFHRLVMIWNLCCLNLTRYTYGTEMLLN